MPSSRKRVLREEDYVEKLEEIISSTYFPDQSCPETRAGALTKFHDTFISEDNENFHNIHQKDRNDHRRRHAYAYGDVKLLMDGVSDGDNNGGGLVKYLTNGGDSILDTDALQDAIKSNRRQKLGSAEAIIKEKNSGILMMTSSEMMPAPPPRKIKSEGKMLKHGRGGDSGGGEVLLDDSIHKTEPFIQPKATRLSPKPVPLRLDSSTLRMIDSIPNGMLSRFKSTNLHYEPSHTASAHSITSSSPRSRSRSQTLDNPIDNNTFVEMTPVIEPGGKGDVSESPIITWGEVNMTPVVLSRGEQEMKSMTISLEGGMKPNPFQIKSEPSRERIGRKLVSNNSTPLFPAHGAHGRGKKRKEGKNSLTEGGRSLLRRANGGDTTTASASATNKTKINFDGMGRSSFGKALSNSYLRKADSKKGDNKGSNSRGGERTPIIGKSRSTVLEKNTSATDNLLK